MSPFAEPYIFQRSFGPNRIKGEVWLEFIEVILNGLAQVTLSSLLFVDPSAFICKNRTLLTTCFGRN